MINVVLIGYSGHSYVVYDCLKSSGHEVTKYCDSGLKKTNLLSLDYLGGELDDNALNYIKKNNFSPPLGIMKLDQGYLNIYYLMLNTSQ